MFVKICGTTNLADAQLAVELGADALGFIFAPSKRQVVATQVAAMTPQLPERILRVGVFTEPDAPEIMRIVEAADLDAVQLHMPYRPGLLEQLQEAFRERVQLWQVIGVSLQAAQDDESERRLAADLQTALVDLRLSIVLLDTVVAGTSGGLGRRFAWERVRPVLHTAQKAAASAIGRAARLPKIVVAGGLDATNVTAAIHLLDPWGVDVVSGIESAPGRKDPARLRAFLQAARGKHTSSSTL